ncbi:LPS chain length-determining protein [Vibrio sp. IB15]|uniref:LPS O-antigen chain length determinant protein WzzB n=1 Tax=Vibrio sp. IB15 TaxID=2779368 RepID=UPI0018E8FC4C|nr:LPS chain length-determining protein [Vibrio sp. IB15]
MKQQVQSQPYTPQNQQVYTPNDEVDFRELFKALWASKLIIILTTTLFAVASTGFAFLTQEWWSSSAKVAKAQLQDISAYQQQVIKLQPVFNVYQEDGTVLVSDELETLVDPKLLFQRFVDTFNSNNNKRAFLNDNADFIAFKTTRIDNADNSEDAERKLYVEWFNRIKASPVDKRNSKSSYNVTFQATTKQSSFDLLGDYILMTESKVHQDVFNDFQAMINGKWNELTQQKKVLETHAKSQLAVELARAKYSMNIALAAGVEKPIQTGDDKERFSIDLGSKGLQAKVKVLESVQNLSVIEPRLQQINAKLEMLANFKVDRNIEFQTFRYLENVSQPVTQDKPKRVLIILFSTLFGGFFSVAFVLIRFVFRKEN